MALVGDFNELKRWERVIGELASDKIRFRVSNKMADAALGFVREGFSGEHDPYRRRWQKKKNPDGRKILHGPTGDLRKFRKSAVNQHGYRLKAGADYFKYLNPKRRMVPGNRVPPRWSSTFRTIYRDACRHTVRSR